MSLTIQYSNNNDFKKWASVGLESNYIIPIKDLLPRSIFGNTAKKLNKIANILMENNLCFDDLLILNKYVTSDGKLKKSACTCQSDIDKLKKISCIIENKESFKDLVKTSGLLSWIGAGAGWLTLLPHVGAVASGIASAAYFMSGDITSGILYLLGIPLAFFGGGFAVKGISTLLRAASRGGGGLTKMLIKGGKLGLATKALALMNSLKSGLIKILYKLKLGKYAKTVSRWFTKTKRTLRNSVDKAKKITPAKARSSYGHSARIDKLIQKNPKQLLKMFEKNPERWAKLTPLQKSMFKKNVKKLPGGGKRLKEITMFHKELGAAGIAGASGKGVGRAVKGVGGVGGIGMGTLMMMDMSRGNSPSDEAGGAQTDSKGKGSAKSKLWSAMIDTSADGYEGSMPFLEQM